MLSATVLFVEVSHLSAGFLHVWSCITWFFIKTVPLYSVYTVDNLLLHCSLECVAFN